MDSDPSGNAIASQLMLLLVLTLVNAFFAGAEMAVVSVNKNKIKMPVGMGAIVKLNSSTMHTIGSTAESASFSFSFNLV